MSKSSQPSLEESYHGLPIPEPENTQPKSYEIAPYCLLCAVFKAFTTALITIGIIVLIPWLVFQPDNLKVYVDDASLTQFDLINANNTLRYHLKLNFSLRNPNRKIGIHYVRVQAIASYDSARIGEVEFPRFHQPRKSTKMVDATFRGDTTSIGSSIVETYKRERREGWFYVRVKMYTRIRLKMIVVKTIVYAPDVDCYLRIPAPINGTASPGFVGTECDVQGFS